MLCLPPSCPVSKLSLFFTLPVCRRSSLLTGEGGARREGVVEEPNKNIAIKSGPLVNIQYSLLYTKFDVEFSSSI
jgi:hypothetical protein